MEEKALKDLLEILSQEYDCLNSLSRLALEKEDAIIKNGIEKLSELLENEQKIIEQIKLLEKERLIIISQIKDLYSLSKEGLTFTELKAELPALWQKELLLIREKLLEKIEELHKRNEKNGVLISEALKINGFSWELLLNIVQSTNQIYGKKRDLGINTSQHIIDHRS